MLRRLILLASVAACLAAGSAASAAATSVCTGTCYAAPAGSGALFLFSGHGWGHGVGMSQYGAYGYALHGADYRTILAHYYPGTTLGPAPATTFRVLLADRKAKLTISSTVPFSVRDGAGTTVQLPAGPASFDTTLRLGGKALVAPLTFVPGKGGPLTLTRAYRGRISVDVVDGKLRAVNVVGLEQYLDGVVPAEMPSNWSAAALEAQAVAARSYALATRNVGAPYDAYSDTRSQMYLGSSVESPATDAAVAATKKQVLWYAGKVATTYFSSTSGGETESALDWTGTAVPYLVSVADPYDAISPYHDWGPVPVTAQAMAKDLKVAGPISDATTVPNAAGRVAKLSLVTATAPVSVPGTTLRSALGLRSTWFTVGVLSLAPPPAAPLVYGSALTLQGVVRGVGGTVTLEERQSGGAWQPVSSVPAGAMKLAQRPTITTDYRLATAAAATGYVRIKVAPSVTLTSFTATEVAGSEQPVLAGDTVDIQQQSPDGSWATVGSAAVAADGTFTVPVSLASGDTYRVSLAAMPGYAAATTAPQIVVR
ncbi:MAG TPA: SpoIID/LytB domain-containing protein [Gaiellaceae bacterium]|nr:SpoIID/LytB domain-containing protein [Gaiellaceae bacterium]